MQEIQKYLDGQLLYIPRKQSNAFSWGEKSGIRDKMAERNRQIQTRFHSGAAISELSDEYCLSEKRIQGIIHACEFSTKNKTVDGGQHSEQRE